MGFIHGKDLVVTVDADDLSAYTKEADLKLDADEHDLTHFGVDDRDWGSGLRAGMFSIKGTYNDAVAGPRATLQPLVGGDAVAVIHQPEGAGSTKAQNAFNAIVKSYNETAAVDGYIEWSADLRVSGTVDDTAQT